jgi:hypothetical protein
LNAHVADGAEAARIVLCAIMGHRAKQIMFFFGTCRSGGYVMRPDVVPKKERI